MEVRAILEQKGRNVHTVQPGMTVGAAAELMKLHNVGALVVSPDGHRVEGLYAERDLARDLVRLGPDLLKTRVEEVMQTALKTCGPGDRLTDVMRTMTRFRARHIPVLEQDRLVGLVSIGDVVKARLDELETETGVLRDRLAGLGG
ncbi:MAG: CBS domain-containing protein [Gemmatimonadota bacterium]|nr:CBS domain-containing protein [Gemmatimonadota bacterium]